MGTSSIQSLASRLLRFTARWRPISAPDSSAQLTSSVFTPAAEVFMHALAFGTTGVWKRFLTMAYRFGLSRVPVHFGDPHRQTHSFFRRAVCGTSSTMP